MELEKVKILQKSIVSYKNKLLILQRNKDDSLGGFWDLPGGNLEFLEKMETGMKREIKEETGLKVSKVELIETKEIIVKLKRKHFLLFLYKTETSSDKIKLSKEHQDYRWIDVKEISKYKLNPIFNYVKDSFKRLK